MHQPKSNGPIGAPPSGGSSVRTVKDGGVVVSLNEDQAKMLSHNRLINLDAEKAKRKDILTPFMVAESLYDEAINNKEITDVLYITVDKSGEMILCYSGEDRFRVLGLIEAAKQGVVIEGVM